MTTNANKKPNNELRVGLYTGLFTLFGALLSAGTGWIIAIQTSSASNHQSCLVRIDAKEAMIRNKVDAFFAAQGNLYSIGSHRVKPDNDLEQRIDAVATAAFSLSSFLDDDMNRTPRIIALQLIEKFSTEKTEEEKKNIEKNNEAIGDNMDKWNAQYKALMDKFESMRKDC
jgi:hypothetical protein